MNISFSMTTAQVERGFATGKIEKDVTRRNGWRNLREGQILDACEKCQGIKKGEKVRKLGRIQVVSARIERLDCIIGNPEYGRRECEREGFPDITPSEFVAFFCRGHKGVTSYSLITRIEFAYLL